MHLRLQARLRSGTVTTAVQEEDNLTENSAANGSSLMLCRQVLNSARPDNELSGPLSVHYDQLTNR